MLAEWNQLTDDLRLLLTRAALEHAASRIAAQAEALASEMENGVLSDRGGPDALRLLAAVVRIGRTDHAVAGHA